VLLVLVVVANMVIVNWMLDREQKSGRTESAAGLFMRKR
jgi:hypothetical protein